MWVVDWIMSDVEMFAYYLVFILINALIKLKKACHRCSETYIWLRKSTKAIKARKRETKMRREYEEMDEAICFINIVSIWYIYNNWWTLFLSSHVWIEPKNILNIYLDMINFKYYEEYFYLNNKLYFSKVWARYLSCHVTRFARRP